MNSAEQARQLTSNHEKKKKLSDEEHRKAVRVRTDEGERKGRKHAKETWAPAVLQQILEAARSGARYHRTALWKNRNTYSPENIGFMYGAVEYTVKFLTEAGFSVRWECNSWDSRSDYVRDGRAESYDSCNGAIEARWEK